MKTPESSKGNGFTGPSNSVDLKAFYHDMLLIRRFEEKAGQLYGMGLIGGFCHLYIGQEAVVVGMQAASRAGDQVITAYRDHGHMLACGMDPKGVMAELTGRAHRLFQGQGRLDAHVQRREEVLRRPRHRRRAGPARHRARLRQQVSRQRRGDAHLFRRRRRQPGPGLRSLQHGRALEAARRLRHREQPIRHGHERRALQRRDAVLQARRVVQHSRASRSTAWMSRRCTPPAAKAHRMVPRRQGPDHPGDEDLSLSRPLDVRSGEVPHARGSAARCARSAIRSSISARS